MRLSGSLSDYPSFLFIFHLSYVSIAILSDVYFVSRHYIMQEVTGRKICGFVCIIRGADACVAGRQYRSSCSWASCSFSSVLGTIGVVREHDLVKPK